MKKKKRIVRTVSLTMSLMMAFSSFAWAESSAKKEETVYVNLTHRGRVKEITVSDHLSFDASEDGIVDVSTLSGIKNVKGNEKPVFDGDKLVWKSSEGEIYYQGKTDKALPLEFKLAYWLDGKEVQPETLAGASGNLKIEMRIDNTDGHSVVVGNRQKEIYTPFAVLAVFNFPSDSVGNVRVNTGKTVDDGNKTIVTYAALPGLKKSMELDDEDFKDILDLPEHLTIEASVKNFEMGDILITAESDSSILDDIEGFDDIIDETVDGVDDLSDASEEVESGIGTLSDGTSELFDKFGSFRSGMASLEDAMDAMEENINGRILDGSSDLYDGMEIFREKTDELKEGSEELYDGSVELEDGLDDAYSGAVELKKGSSSLVQGIGQMAASAGASGLDTGDVSDAIKAAVEQAVQGAVEGAIAQDIGLTDEQKAVLRAAAEAAGENAGESAGEAIKDSLDTELATLMATLGGGLGQLMVGAQALDGGISDLKSGLWQLSNGAEDLSDGIKTLDENADLFQEGAQELADGAYELNDGLETLGDASEMLNEGVSGLADASKTAADGIRTLNEGAAELYEGYNEFDEDGVNELREKVYEKTGSYDELIETKGKLISLSEEYCNYSGIGEDMEGQVAFVMKIDGIEIEEVEDIVEETEEENEGFVEWIKSMWNKLF